MIITAAMTRPRKNNALALKVKAEPSTPMTPPRIKNAISRPTWKRSCGRTRSPSLAKVADIDSTSPPTTAMQVESEATMPMINAVP